MARIKVSKNLYRGVAISCIDEVKALAWGHESIAWLREDGTYLVRPAQFFARWNRELLEERMDFLYYTTPYRSFWAWLKEKICKKS